MTTRRVLSLTNRLACKNSRPSAPASFASIPVRHHASKTFDVKITQSTSADDAPAKTQHSVRDTDSKELLDRLLLRTSEMIDPHAANAIAYSGGVDSSVVAALVHRCFADNETKLQSSSQAQTNQGSVQAILGISPAVPQSQIIMARRVAEMIGIPLTEVPTAEGSDEAYRRNDGYACFVCKTHLYSTLETVANAVLEQQQRQKHLGSHHNHDRAVILYNGTNADDTQDPTRLGLIAASNFQVHSPLDQISKEQVRQAARYLCLPNWNAAASPCLRSRLAMGVTATEEHLRAVEMAEEWVRRVLQLDATVNARVRMLAGSKAMVELDESLLEHRGQENWAEGVLRENGFEQRCIDESGFNSFGGVRGFRTGSVAAMPADDTRPLASASL